MDDLPDRAAQRIAELRLAPHPEGGYFRETHRSPLRLPAAALPRHLGERAMMTSILFLLPAGQRSAWHRVRSEELWLHHEGDALRLRIDPGPRCPAGAPPATLLGPGGTPQAIVPAGWWQDAEALAGGVGYALVGCVVAPGFEFEDFELAEGEDRPE